jgi:hypothetical protein
MSYEHTLHRSFFERASELAPTEWFEIGLRGDGLNNNYLVVGGAHTLNRHGSFSGTAYSFLGPADAVASPRQLNVRKGDKVRLEATGEANDGKELTIEAVGATTLTVYETLTIDSADYKFVVQRRSA